MSIGVPAEPCARCGGTGWYWPRSMGRKTTANAPCPDCVPRPIGGDGQPYNEHELYDFREYQSKNWNPAYNGHRWLATIAARDVDLFAARNALIAEGMARNNADAEIARLRAEHDALKAIHLRWDSKLLATEARVTRLEAALRWAEQQFQIIRQHAKQGDCDGDTEGAIRYSCSEGSQRCLAALEAK